ncbi:phosphomevalonate kinase [Terramyces sp. JEL0728]|nr:phosphomevalonate kinase [Terramyces sp. JEL0728]
MTIGRKVACSAPGKVLVCGGYLVLDQAYSGIVCALDARFHVEIKEMNSETSNIYFEIHSPQFTDGIWKYEYDRGSDKLVSYGNNPFLHTVLAYTMRYISAKRTLLPTALKVVVNADNDFYSQLEYLESNGLPVNAESLKKIPSFNSTGTSIGQVHKTGLGSSAALVAALVSSILVQFDIIQVVGSQVQEGGLQIIEQLAQCNCIAKVDCHCLAQGKIGSGFDISCAIYGSQIYNRFNPELINMDKDLKKEKLVNVIEKRWDTKITDMRVPPGFILQMGDVHCGSNTPKMVSKVLEWRLNFPELSKSIWDEISLNNNTIISQFGRLLEIEKSHSKEYFSKIRKLLKQMGELADVQIEPNEQTLLLDQSQDIDGVLLAGVPGAGGYDAIVCLVIGESSRSRLLEFWSSQKNVTPLLASQSEQGVRFVLNEV